MKIKVKKLRKDAKLPKFAYEGDAGMDLYSTEEYTLKPGERKIFGTGIAIELPEGFVSLVWDKSGLAAKHGIKTMAGVIDCHYRGEYLITLLNTSDEEYMINKGDKIAQFLVQKVESPEILEVDMLSETTRGEGKFGSTGK